MTDAVQIALIVAFPTVLGIARSWYADHKAAKKLDHITVLTNSTLTAAQQRIAQLEDVIRRLVEEVHLQHASGLAGPVSAADIAQGIVERGAHGERTG